MRQQFAREKFGLVFGAGIGVDLKFPSWDTLLEEIAKHSSVQAEQLISTSGRNSTTFAQQLFQHYAAKNPAIDKTPRMHEMELRAGWRKIVHDSLYKGLPEDVDKLIAEDKYLVSLIPLIKKSPLTVTYNFDDTLQRLLLRDSKAKGEQTRGYRTLWSGNAQLHSRSGGVIYHPNGFLPFTRGERPSDHLVFSEDSFADQLIDSMAGRYASLATHFSQTTCLLVGLSLQDPTLKHLLRQSAVNFPGHFHYFVKYVRDASKRNEISDNAEAAANFNVYNLQTLFLTGEEINSLAQLISAQDHEFTSLAQEVVPHFSFRYFVVGSVAAGKSTTVNYFRSLLTQDEWTEQRAPNMEKAPDLLTDAEKIEIDNWVAEQVNQKNLNLIKTASAGIHVIDRAPLDAFAFTLDKDEWSSKAMLLRSAIAPGLATKRSLMPGHVIFLKNDPEVMAERAISLHKNTTATKLNDQQEALLHVYKKLKPGNGVTVINAFQKSPGEVAKEVANIIFREGYVEADMHKLLLDIEEKGYDA
ncbi:SIR2 family protein [Pseudoduganella namucuonensis]|uniref:SIR2-like domain-containing protein n=1 Tax=Pseudoduganella namucuonensis TaxID=1035707 RepID=A0A1I7LTE6_9BURK|nr:SIR2 family protein [Pseudoduganella namucuonensis]SFV12870.1 SIR2-like domain-containing protein [Pseudoduganella namucuonensis]